MKSRAKNTMKRVLSWTLIVTLMLTFMPLIEYPLSAASPEITNISVRQAIFDSFGITESDLPYEDKTIINISGNSDVIGTLDLTQIVLDYPDVTYINISDTNITDIKDDPDPSKQFKGTVMRNKTFTKDDTLNKTENPNPRTLSLKAGTETVVYNLENQTEGIPLINLIGLIQTPEGSPPDLIASVKSVTINDGTPIVPTPVGQYGVIEHTDLAGLDVRDDHKLVLELVFKNVETLWTYKLEYKLQIKDVKLKPTPSTIDAYQGGAVSFTISKFDAAGKQVQLNPADLVSITDSLFQLTPTMVKSGKNVLVEGIIATNATIGDNPLTITDTSGREAEITIKVDSLDPISGLLELYEENALNPDDPVLALDQTDDTVYIKGGTAISSNVMTRATATYKNSTIYLLEDASGDPLSGEYITLLKFVDQSNKDLTGEFIEVDLDPMTTQAALRITAPPVDSATNGTFEIQLLADNTSLTDSIKYQIISGTVERYRIYQIDTADYPTNSNLQDIINNDDSGAEVIAEYENKNDGNGWTPIDGKNTAEIIEGNEAYFVVGVKYSASIEDPYYLASVNAIKAWYEISGANFTNGDTSFDQNQDIKAEITTTGGVSTNALVVSPEVGTYDELVKAAVQIIGEDSTLPFNIRIKERSIIGYEFRQPNGFDLNPSDYEIPIGSTKAFQIYAIYDNGDKAEMNFAESNKFTFSYENNEYQSITLFPVDDNINNTPSEQINNPSVLKDGNIVTFEATHLGGPNDYIADSEVTVIVTGPNGKTGEITLKLTNSLVKGLTYYVETPGTIFEYGNPSKELVKIINKDDPGFAKLTIPRGLSAYVWVIPEFTNTTMYNKNNFSDWSSYAIQAGITTETTLISGGLGTPTQITAMGNSHINAYEISTAGEVLENIGEPVPYKIEVHGPVTSNGTQHKLAVTEALTTLLVEVGEPVVTKVIPQVWTLVSSNPELYEYKEPLRGGSGEYAISSKVGEELKLRLKVVYSDGTSVDEIGNSQSLTYTNGTYFIPFDDLTSYEGKYEKSPADSSLDNFSEGTIDEMSVIYGRFMSRNPLGYSGKVNKGVAPSQLEWNNGNTPPAMHVALMELSEEIKINAIGQNDESKIKVGPLTNDFGGVPGHYSIKLFAANEEGYEVDFSGIYNANGYNRQQIHIEDSKIIITTSLPTIEKVYLVNLGAEIEDDINDWDLYKFVKSKANKDKDSDYHVFTVYPMILDSRYYQNDAYDGELPEYLTDNTESLGISKVLADDWQDGSIGNFISSSQGDLGIEVLEEDGYIYLKVTVYKPEITKANPETISLELDLVYDQEIIDNGAEKYKLSPQPADPTKMAIYTVLGIMVQDIGIGPGYSDTHSTPPVFEIELGETIFFPVTYFVGEQEATSLPRPLLSTEYPIQAKPENASRDYDVLKITEIDDTPEGCIVSMPPSSSVLAFKPQALGTYTFELSTMNVSDTTIPTSSQGKRTITFTVNSPTISQNVYFGETVEMKKLPSEYYNITEEGSALLDPAALSNGFLKIIDNPDPDIAPISATVIVTDEEGKTLATYELSLYSSDIKYTLVPFTDPQNMLQVSTSNDSAGNLRWKVEYIKVGGPDDGEFVKDNDYILVDVNKFEWLDESDGDFLELEPDGNLKVINTSGTLPKYGVYSAVEPGGDDDVTQKLYAVLSDQWEETIYEYELHDENGDKIIAPINLTAGKTTKVYVYDVTNSAYIDEFAVISSDESVVTAVNTTGMPNNYALLRGIATGEATITFTPIAGGASLTLDVEVDAPVIPKYEISGKITGSDTAGLGIPNAEVKLYKTSAPNTVIGTVDAELDGTYKFTDVKAGDYIVKASADGYDDNSRTVTISDTDMENVNIELTKSSEEKYEISGTITGSDTAGLGIPNAKVKLYDKLDTSFTTVLQTVDAKPDGTYKFTDVEAGDYIVKASADGYDDNSRTVTISDTDMEGVDIELTKSSEEKYEISGTITGSDTAGLGIPNAEVKLYAQSDTNFTTVLQTVDAKLDGTYKFDPVIVGEYTVVASADGYTTGTRDVEVSVATQDVSGIDIELTLKTYTISGTITNGSTLESIDGVTVKLFNENDEEIASTETISGGTYTFDTSNSSKPIVAGEYTVKASASEYDPGETTTEIVDTDKTGVDIVLMPTGTPSITISGQIKDSSTNNIITGATVKLTNNTTGISISTTATNGNYSFTVVAGEYTIEASHDNYTSKTVPADASGGSITVDIKLDPKGGTTPTQYKVSGKIKSTTGKAIYPATVTLTDGTSTRTAPTNIFGNYTFNNVPNGDYVVTASAAGYITNSGDVSVTSGNETCDITLQSSGTTPDPDWDLCSAFIVLSQNPIKVGEYSIATINTFNFGKDLTYSWTNSNNSVATLTGSGDNVKLTSVKPGTTIITCTVSDGTNTKTVTIELKVIANISSVGNMVVLPVIVPGLGTYTVTYDSQGGSSVNKLTNVTTGAKITPPVEPKRDGYTFDGWYKEAVCLNVWDFNTDTVTRDITLYAKWTKDEVVEEKPEVKEPEKEVEKEEPAPEPVKPIVTDTHEAYISGYGDNKFGPDDNITRAQATQIFYNLLSDSDKAAAAAKSFGDVDSGAWYYEAVSVMADLGIATGVADDKFDPETPITREDFTAMAVRFAGLAPISGATGFSDVSENDATAGYIKAAVNAGYILGYNDNTFKPTNEITRAEAVTIVNRVLVRVPDKGYINASLSMLTTFTDVTTAHWGYYEILEAANTHEYIKDGKTEEWID